MLPPESPDFQCLARTNLAQGKELIEVDPFQYLGSFALISHNFLHLTLQESFAALYWSRTPSSQQLEELVRRPDLFPLDQFLEGKHKLLFPETKTG